MDTNYSKINPVIIDNELNSECWTFYKMAVLETVVGADYWLASHMHYYVNEDFVGRFGENGRQYEMKDYESILKMKRIPLKQASPETIINVIKKIIQDGKYVVLFLNFSIMKNKVGTQIHEILIYGYEDNYFISPVLENGSFIEKRIPFETIVNAYKYCYDRYMENGWDLLCRRRFFFGVTEIQPVDEYINDKWIHEFIQKLRVEKNGRIVERYNIGKENIKEKYYEGIAAVYFFSKKLQNSEDSYWTPTMLRIAILAVKTAFDHRRLIVRNMKFYMNFMNAEDDQLMISTIEKYSKLSYNLQNVYLLMCKYRLNGDIKLLKYASEICEAHYMKEAEVLQDFEDCMWPYYYKYNCVPQPPENE